MKKRPLAVIIISGIYALAGIVGVAYHASELGPGHPFTPEAAWVLLVRALAIVAGVFMFLGRDWARWLALAWMAFHVLLSAFHSVSELAMHALLLAAFTWFLSRPAASEFFNQRKPPGLGKAGVSAA
jgi:hypothetical protein